MVDDRIPPEPVGLGLPTKPTKAQRDAAYSSYAKARRLKHQNEVVMKQPYFVQRLQQSIDELERAFPEFKAKYDQHTEQAAASPVAKDKRRRLRAHWPARRVNMVTVALNSSEYTVLYQRAQRSGRSFADELRRLITDNLLPNGQEPQDG